ncbi:MAG TPA: hypothetical protein RMH85_02140 [Polyangiaceae bacterium LLY-WYZ-15_(1-7)]|nr:hypothetical protein [Myxococcales bacterium]MAT28768.1 hypothetical protein [Sandaracinus sp.]HJL00952.1 hypothetical protein [Polyangiaceae bacterium LLY-WYZ-15_(1-7)]MBJ74734.1 hypothetical protein [Sandaracinus sp.]HJL07266.1 hypothetical protein [Polyangiaceae bacterium LLY-WYZ-15_(1-7)]
MPTWAEVQEYARSKYKLADDRDNSFKLVFEYQNKRLQAVIVSRFEALNRDWCDFASACCKLDQMNPEVALRKNFQFAVGALCLDRDTYIVRYSVQMATMDMEEFELPLHVVASTADKLEQEFAASDRF